MITTQQLASLILLSILLLAKGMEYKYNGTQLHFHLTHNEDGQNMLLNFNKLNTKHNMQLEKQTFHSN